MTLQVPGFQFVCKVAELRDRVPSTFEVGDRFVVVVSIDGELNCIEDLCTHDGGTLGGGELEGFCIVCPRHGAKFDIRTGDAVCMPATEPTLKHELSVVDDQVFVRLAD